MGQQILHIHSDRGSIALRLTPEQAEISSKMLAEKIPTMWDIGFSNPSQIESYYCKKCHREYTSPPKARVSIRTSGSEQPDTGVIYACTTCGKPVHYDLLPSPAGIPGEFIEFDETGDFKQPTSESIDSLLAGLVDTARQGCGSSISRPGYAYNLAIAERWAKKVGYDIRAQVENLTEAFRKGYVARLERELPELIRDIKENAYGFSLLEDETKTTCYEGTGLCERMDQLFQTIELTTPASPDVNADILRILGIYRNMYYHEKRELLNKKTELEAMIAGAEEALAAARRTESDFVRKVKMTNEQVTAARTTTLDAWPLRD